MIAAGMNGEEWTITTQVPFKELEPNVSKVSTKCQLSVSLVSVDMHAGQEATNVSRHVDPQVMVHIQSIAQLIYGQ